jgi:hypothetical protein
LREKCLEKLFGRKKKLLQNYNIDMDLWENSFEDVEDGCTQK